MTNKKKQDDKKRLSTWLGIGAAVAATAIIALHVYKLHKLKLDEVYVDAETRRNILFIM